jgi:MtN3 and saliva related transmembrane protein
VIAAIGVVAGVLTTLAWLPQLHHTRRRRSADDISWAHLLTVSTGVAAWLAYGVLERDVPLLTANGVTLALVLWLIGLKAVGGAVVDDERDEEERDDDVLTCSSANHTAPAEGAERPRPVEGAHMQ